MAVPIRRLISALYRRVVTFRHACQGFWSAPTARPVALLAMVDDAVPADTVGPRLRPLAGKAPTQAVGAGGPVPAARHRAPVPRCCSSWLSRSLPSSSRARCRCCYPFAGAARRLVPCRSWTAVRRAGPRRRARVARCVRRRPRVPPSVRPLVALHRRRQHPRVEPEHVTQPADRDGDALLVESRRRASAG
jgi:hypothetical protein